MSDRTVEYDLNSAVFNWAAKSRDGHGRPFLRSNPLKGLRTPKEKNPTRIVLAEAEYQALLGVSQRVGWRFYVALVLAHETGQRVPVRVIHGKESPKVLQGCTICAFCPESHRLPRY